MTSPKFLGMCLTLVLLDIISVAGVYLGALWLRFDCVASQIPAEYANVCKNSLGYSCLFAVFIYALFHLYRRVWRVASFRELELCLFAVCTFGILHGVLLEKFWGPMPISYYLGGGFFQFVILCITRFGYRFWCIVIPQHFNNNKKRTRALIIGAGSAASMIIREVNSSPLSDSVICCAIDDETAKLGCSIEGVKVVGGRDCIMQAVEQYKIEKIFFAIPSLPAQERRDILNICKETHAQLLALPGIYQLANEDVSVSQMREVSIADLLGRPPIQVNNEEILNSLTNKVILVTGGGGSIGSELCRQIAAHSPKQLIIFDVYENNAYEIEQELKRKYGASLNLIVLIGSVRDTRRINNVFETYRPEFVFHAAAHKHVPLMENSPCESIKNNVLGTYKTACAAMTHGCRRFLLISTDKAVNPTNIMGASKRVCEMVIQTMNRISQSGDWSELPRLQQHLDLEAGEKDFPQKPADDLPKTEFVAVRFGNVLGSNGSVIPLFKKQIAEGGPLTVTHPDIIRYFMTIPEAVSLVLQAGVYAKGGEIFVLDMGEPVKIVDLARNLIKLSGLQPDVDIKIEFTGLRPGEKLYEEKLMAEEGMERTPNHLIHIAHPLAFDSKTFLEKMMSLASAAYNNSPDIRERVEQIAATYHPAR